MSPAFCVSSPAGVGKLDVNAGAPTVVRRAAHAVDGEQQAAQSGLEGESARFRRHHVYQHLMAAAVSAHPSAVSGLLQSQAALQDPWLLDYMYEYLVQADMTELLLADAPFSRLEDFLLRAAAMDPDLTRPVPSMDRAQAKCLGVLADLYVQQVSALGVAVFLLCERCLSRMKVSLGICRSDDTQGCLDKTASVLEALARRDGAQLQERRSLLTRAIAAGESASISTLDVRLLLKIVDLQAEVLDRIDKTGPASLTAVRLTTRQANALHKRVSEVWLAGLSSSFVMSAGGPLDARDDAPGPLCTVQ